MVLTKPRAQQLLARAVRLILAAEHMVFMHVDVLMRLVMIIASTRTSSACTEQLTLAATLRCKTIIAMPVSSSIPD